MTRSSASVSAALSIAVLAVLPLAWVFTTDDDTASPATSATDGALVSASSTSSTSSTSIPVAQDPLVVTVTEPTPAVGGLSSPIASVLHARGFSESMPGSELDNDLPESVVRILIDREVVLTIATEDEGGAGEGAP